MAVKSSNLLDIHHYVRYIFNYQIGQRNFGYIQGFWSEYGTRLHYRYVFPVTKTVKIVETSGHMDNRKVTIYYQKKNIINHTRVFYAENYKDALTICPTWLIIDDIICIT